MIKLREVDTDSQFDLRRLYALLDERTPEQSISHKTTPSFDDHAFFVKTRPYQHWYLILDEYSRAVGSIYITRQRELGVAVFRRYQRKGYGQEAVRQMMWMHPGRFLANVNPANEASIRFWESLGFKHIQNTYALDAANHGAGALVAPGWT